MATDCAAAAPSRSQRSSQPEAAPRRRQSAHLPSDSGAFSCRSWFDAWSSPAGRTQCMMRRFLSRTDPLGQGMETRKLVLTQRARLVAADEHLEHDAAIDIDEGDEGRRFAHERPFDKADRIASLMPEMAVQSLRPHQVEITAADLARRYLAGKLEDRIVGMNDQRHLAPLRDVLHRVRKCIAATDTHHLRRKRLDHGARRGPPFPRHVLDHSTRILRHMRPEIGEVRTQHDVLPCNRARLASSAFRSSGGARLALGLYDLKALELGMAQIEAFAGFVVGAGMGAAELFRPGPGLECGLVDPSGVRRIQRVIVGHGTLQEVELYKSGDVAEIGFPGRPDGLERFLRACLYLKPIHRDKHLKTS